MPTFEEEKRKRIEKFIAKKEARQNKTQVGINICWSINCATQACSILLGNSDSSRETKQEWVIMCVKELYPRFQELYREEMLEQMPEEETIVPTEGDEKQEDFNFPEEGKK